MSLTAPNRMEELEQARATAKKLLLDAIEHKASAWIDVHIKEVNRLNAEIKEEAERMQAA